MTKEHTFYLLFELILERRRVPLIRYPPFFLLYMLIICFLSYHSTICHDFIILFYILRIVASTNYIFSVYSISPANYQYDIDITRDK